MWGVRFMSAVTYPLAPDGIYLSRQGEGHLTGQLMVFVRFAGCDLANVCGARCDTDFGVDRRIDLAPLVSEIQEAAGTATPWVWITGGEPTLHPLTPLLVRLKDLGFRLAVATHGERELTDPVDWLSVTPKRVGRLAQRFGHEIKVVPGLSAASADVLVRECEEVDFWFRYVQPLWREGGECPSSRATCERILRERPWWHPSEQHHKRWGVR